MAQINSTISPRRSDFSRVDGGLKHPESPSISEKAENGLAKSPLHDGLFYFENLGTNMNDISLPSQKKLTCMIGHPVAENPIDQMFDSVFAHYGLNWQFWKSDIASEAEVGPAIGGIRAMGFAGFCITVPYKVASMPYLDELDRDVEAIGAANYVTVLDGRLIGHNNDGKGVVKAIEKITPVQGKKVVMLGAGGAGRAMAVELAWAGAERITLVTRRALQGQEVSRRVTEVSGVPCDFMAWENPVSIPPETDILMNATHLGCAPDLEMVPVDWNSITQKTTVVDVITNPRMTPFLENARERGCPVVDGVEMLVQLAMQIFEEWTGIRPEEAVFQRAVSQALGE